MSSSGSKKSSFPTELLGFGLEHWSAEVPEEHLMAYAISDEEWYVITLSESNAVLEYQFAFESDDFFERVFIAQIPFHGLEKTIAQIVESLESFHREKRLHHFLVEQERLHQKELAQVRYCFGPRVKGEKKPQANLSHYLNFDDVRVDSELQIEQRFPYYIAMTADRWPYHWETGKVRRGNSFYTHEDFDDFSEYYKDEGRDYGVTDYAFELARKVLQDNGDELEVMRHPKKPLENIPFESWQDFVLPQYEVGTELRLKTFPGIVWRVESHPYHLGTGACGLTMTNKNNI